MKIVNKRRFIASVVGLTLVVGVIATPSIVRAYKRHKLEKRIENFTIEFGNKAMERIELDMKIEEKRLQDLHKENQTMKRASDNFKKGMGE